MLKFMGWGGDGIEIQKVRIVHLYSVRIVLQNIMSEAAFISHFKIIAFIWGERCRI